MTRLHCGNSNLAKISCKVRHFSGLTVLPLRIVTLRFVFGGHGDSGGHGGTAPTMSGVDDSTEGSGFVDGGGDVSMEPARANKDSRG